MSKTINMKVLDRTNADVALAQFLTERNEYEHKHQLSHNDRNYEVRRKFKNAGILPKYTNDDALGDFQITDSTDLDVISDESVFKINTVLKEIDKKSKLLVRVRKVKHTKIKVCGCFKCQEQVDVGELKVNPAKKDKDKNKE